MRCAAVVVLLLLTACSADDQTAPNSPGLSGRYPLRTVAGRKPPAVLIESPDVTNEILSGVVHLHDNGTFADSTVLRITNANGTNVVTDVAAGTYVQVPGRIDFSSTRGEVYSMTVSETSLYQDLAGNRLIYRR